MVEIFYMSAWGNYLIYGNDTLVYRAVVVDSLIGICKYAGLTLEHE